LPPYIRVASLAYTPHVHSATTPVELTGAGNRELDTRNGVGGGGVLTSQDGGHDVIPRRRRYRNTAKLVVVFYVHIWMKGAVGKVCTLMTLCT
jgi:hypothetical protein